MVLRKFKISYSGGDIIGTGSYKNVIRPGIMCQRDKYISAIFTGENANRNQELEARLLDTISTIDLKKNLL